MDVPRGTATAALEHIAHLYGTLPEVDCRRSKIELSEEELTGRMISYQNISGMDALLFDLEGPVKLTLRFSGDFPSPLTLFSICSGTMVVSDETQSFQLSPLQSAIHGGFAAKEHSWAINGTDGFRAMILSVHKDHFFKELDCETLRIPSPLLKVVSTAGAANFLHDDIYHLPIINAVREILQRTDTGLQNSSFVAAKMHLVLYLQIDIYRSQLMHPGRSLVRRQEKIQLIQAAEKILTGRLRNPPTIPELARMVGLNQQTLKMGFRQLYGDSINQYLNARRMEQAGVLLRTGDFTIRDVAYEVGYNNAGYFSRKFKERYGVSPRYFAGAGVAGSQVRG